MNKKDFKKELNDKNIPFKEKDEYLVVSGNNVDLSSLNILPENTIFKNKGWVNLRGLTILPENIIFKNKGAVYLNSLIALPENAIFENKEAIVLSSLTTLPENTTFKNKGPVHLNSLCTLPENTTFKNKGSVHLNSLCTLPENTVFKNKGWINLKSLCTLSENTTFKNKGFVDLKSLCTLPENTIFKNKGWVDLRSLKILSESTIFKNKGWVDLRSLCTLPENTIFKNKGDVYLSSLNNQKIKYQGVEILIKDIDGETMIITSTKQKGDFIIYKSKYFKGGVLEDLPQCYITQLGKFYAHGETIKSAITDVEFKYQQENLDVSDLVKKIKKSLVVTDNDYRLLTGACSAGVQEFKKQHRITADKLPLKEVLELTKDSYGGKKLQELFN